MLSLPSLSPAARLDIKAKVELRIPRYYLRHDLSFALHEPTSSSSFTLSRGIHLSNPRERLHNWKTQPTFSIYDYMIFRLAFMNHPPRPSSSRGKYVSLFLVGICTTGRSNQLSHARQRIPQTSVSKVWAVNVQRSKEILHADSDTSATSDILWHHSFLGSALRGGI